MRFAAEPLMFKSSSTPNYDSTQNFGPNPGDLWVDMSVPLLKRMTQKNPDVWVSVEGGGAAITLQTNGVSNASQSTLNLVAGSNVTLTNTSGGDVQIAAAGAGAVVFSDAEIPTGTINGVNTTFTLAATPNPTGSLELFLNGVLQRAGGNDYTLSVSTITMAVAPATGDTLIAWYRH
jgi:hypothetical protein